MRRLEIYKYKKSLKNILLKLFEIKAFNLGLSAFSKQLHKNRTGCLKNSLEIVKFVNLNLSSKVHAFRGTKSNSSQYFLANDHATIMVLKKVGSFHCAPCSAAHLIIVIFEWLTAA